MTRLSLHSYETIVQRTPPSRSETIEGNREEIDLLSRPQRKKSWQSSKSSPTEWQESERFPCSFLSAVDLCAISRLPSVGRSWPMLMHVEDGPWLYVKHTLQLCGWLTSY